MLPFHWLSCKASEDFPVSTFDSTICSFVFDRHILLCCFTSHQDLLECVPVDDAGYVLLQEAHQLTKTFLTESSTQQLRSLFPSGRAFGPGGQGGACGAALTARHLVKNGFLVELQSDGKRKQRHCFLFTDLIVCTKYKSTSAASAQLEVKWYLPLTHVSAVVDDAAARLNVSALTNVASLRFLPFSSRTRMALNEPQRKRRQHAVCLSPDY